jgi:hypothetical protein
LLALLILSAPVRGADPLTDAVAQIYPDYRAALFRTNNGPPEGALAAIRKTAEGWQALARRFAPPLPAPYAGETGWTELTTRVAAVLGQAEAEAAAGRMAAAHETLEEIRDLLGAFRARNGVFTFSDAMNAYHEEMERAAPLAAEGAAKLPELRELAGVLHHLAERLLPAAPEAWRTNPHFGALDAANRAAVEAFRSAVRGGDPAAIRQAAQGLRGPYSRMFLRFG